MPTRPTPPGLPTPLAALLDQVEVARMRHDLQRLCAPELAGRRVGTPGHDHAAAWLAERLAQLGAIVTRQPVAVPAVMDLAAAPTLTVLERTDAAQLELTHRRHIAEHPRTAPLAEPVTATAHWLGADGDTGHTAAPPPPPERGWGWVLVDPVPTDGLDRLAARLAAQGAVGLLVAQHPDPHGFLAKRLAGGTPLPLPVLAVRADLLTALDGRQVRVRVPVRRAAAHGTNILGQRPGSDPNLAGAPLLLVAHYDGVGDDPQQRLPGAGDNATGVAVTLEAARILTAATLPPRPVALALTDAEEVGALGAQVHARWLVAVGVRPLVVNLDMAGWLHEPVAVEATPSPELTTPLLRALDRAGRWLGIRLAGGPVASDNRRYAAAGLAAVGLGLGARAYHSPADTPDQVDDHALRTAARLLLATAWQLARNPEPAAEQANARREGASRE